MKEASYYEKLGEKKVKCLLCPHSCTIIDGKYGKCKSRKNENGTLYTTVYEKIISIHLDPIEKKPLKHFYENSKILSVGTTGCNFHCKFCQNCEISQCKIEDIENKYIEIIDSERLVDLASNLRDNIGIAFTYNEPSVWFEYVLETSKLAQLRGLKAVMVTNGFINIEPLKELNPFIDAYSIDLKSYDNYLYKNLAGGEIEPVINNIEYIIKSGKHVEIDYLVIPGYNDDLEKFRKLMIYYLENFGKNIPLHINRYFPRYQMKIEATKKDTLVALEKIAKEYLNFVYLGNV